MFSWRKEGKGERERATYKLCVPEVLCEEVRKLEKH